MGDGFHLLYTNRDTCLNSTGLGITYNLSAVDVDDMYRDVISGPAVNCERYFSGCTNSWVAEQTSVPVGDYRLCWCKSSNCTASDFVVEIGILTLRVEAS